MESACLWLIAGGVALVGAWIGIAQAIRPDPSRYSPGELAAVHSAWEKNCDACHRPQADPELKDLLAVAERWRDFTCEKCHGDARCTKTSNLLFGQTRSRAMRRLPIAHHGGQDEVVDEALADAACVRCHADLPSHAKSDTGVAAIGDELHVGTSRVQVDRGGISQEADVQPLAAHDEGAHIRSELGQAFHDATATSQSRSAFRYLDRRWLGLCRLEMGMRPLRHTPPAPPSNQSSVRARLRSCHHLDGSSAKAVRGDGRLFAPIEFERDCKACHSLKTIVAGDDAASYTLVPPHGQQPNVLAPWLTRELTLAVVQDQTKGADVKLFGGRLDPREREKIEQALKPRVEALTAAAKKKLFGSDGTCAKCHEIEAAKIVPPEIPTVWLTKSWFDHASHRALDCAACHPGKTSVVKDGVTELGVPERLGIPGIETCRKCHGPTSAGAAGVRAGCVDCHRYHNGDHPLEGRGAAAFDPAAKKTIEEWIQGR